MRHNRRGARLMGYRTRLRVALWIVASLIGVGLAVSSERGNAVLVTIALTVLVFAAAAADHALAIRESRP